MEWNDLSNLRESAGAYLDAIQYSGYRNADQLAEQARHIHGVIADFQLDEIGSALAGFNVNQTSVITEVRPVVKVVKELAMLISQEMPTALEIDPDADKVMAFCNAASVELDKVMAELMARTDTDPTAGDNHAARLLQLYIAGKYQGMEFGQFMKRVVLSDIGSDITQKAVARRVSHLVATCNDPGTKALLQSWHDQKKREHEAVATPTDTPTPDYSHMESFPPTIPFDMSRLYRFLIDEGVLDEEKVKEELFASCINYGDIEPIFSNALSQNKFKLALHVLKSYYRTEHQGKRNINPDWFIVVCNSVDSDPRTMSQMNFKKETKANFIERMKKAISMP